MSAPFVAVFDYGIGNLRSAQKAFTNQGAQAELTEDPQKILAADGVVLPGVGHFGTCMQALQHKGLDNIAKEVVERDIPFLGICVGMQMLYEASSEAPEISGLGIFPGEISLLPDSVRRPQIQWNKIRSRLEHPILNGLDESWMYFVHSYISPVDDLCVASSFYGVEFVAVAAKHAVVATQFHPEKSGKAGLTLIRNFIEML